LLQLAQFLYNSYCKFCIFPASFWGRLHITDGIPSTNHGLRISLVVRDKLVVRRTRQRTPRADAVLDSCLGRPGLGRLSHGLGCQSPGGHSPDEEEVVDRVIYYRADTVWVIVTEAECVVQSVTAFLTVRNESKWIGQNHVTFDHCWIGVHYSKE